jgi:alpha-beta hydrolase superfamily lysophospholipase
LIAFPLFSTCAWFYDRVPPRKKMRGSRAAYGKSSLFADSLNRRLLSATVSVGVIVAMVLSIGPPLMKAQTPGAGKRSDVQRVLPITAFYDTPDPLPPGKAGELIRSEEVEQYEVPYPVSAVRILYHSRSAAGNDVATSGVVLVPSEQKPPSGGWPVIAWAHGAAGVARSCAPSLMRNVGHGPILSMYVNLGYAVVATDYTGLGTNFRNAFMDSSSNATDVVNSVPAARTAVPQLGARWIVMGEAEGGLTALAVAEKENEMRDPGYLGAIAISDLATAKEVSGHGSSSLMLMSLAYGIETVYPQFKVTDMLTQKAFAAYRDIEQMCSQARTISELSPGQTVKPGWESNSFVRQYFRRNELGQTRAYGPVLVISSDADRATLARITSPAIADMCKQGDQVQWERFPDLDPATLIGDSVRGQIGWIEGRFAGRPDTGKCP